MSFPPVNLITLHETPEREQKAIHELQKYPLHIKVHRFHRQSPGWKGCIDSHLQVYVKGEETNEEVLFICEDNILAVHGVFPQREYNNLIRFIKEDQTWGIIFTGGYILRMWDWVKPTSFPQIYETRNNNHGTVSYLIHRRVYRDILALHRLSPINEHFDIFLSRYKTLIYNPLMFYHAHNVKSNINSQSDVWRKVWFHPKAMKFHSFVFFNQKLVLLILLVIIVGGWWWFRNKVAKRSQSSSTTEVF